MARQRYVSDAQAYDVERGTLRTTDEELRKRKRRVYNAVHGVQCKCCEFATRLRYERKQHRSAIAHKSQAK